ncbi:transposase [Escherichia coli O157:H7]|nr:Transposase [Escherichia coli O157:H7 str. EDL933]OAN08032.1 transposase [Escherichia coli O157:H7]
MIWQPEFTDKTLSRKPGAVHTGGGDGGLTSAERQRLKELERENRELRRSNDILRQASAYFAKAEFDRLWKK